MKEITVSDIFIYNKLIITLMVNKEGSKKSISRRTDIEIEQTKKRVDKLEKEIFEIHNRVRLLL